MTRADLQVDQLRLMAEEFPGEVGYSDASTGESLTFTAWDCESNSVARWLASHGVSKGDRVSIHLPPDEPIRWLVAYAAIHKAGAVAVPTNTRLTASELANVLRHAGAVAVFTGSTSSGTLADARPSLPDLDTIVTPTAWEELLRTDDSPFRVVIDGDDIADLMYTSGTTGKPKAVVVRHRTAALVPNGKPRWTGSGWLHASPFFTFAGIASIYNPMKLGMRGLYLPRFDVDRWLDIVATERPSAVFLVPAMAELLIAHPRSETADLSMITMCSVGSAPIAPGTLTRLQELMPAALVSNGWGMTEAGPAFCFMPPDEAERRVGSVGRPLPPTEFRIIDEEGGELPAGEPGELLVRNPGREREYFNDPDATASTWRDGWLHTGDLAYLDADGFLYIVGRKKDVIIRGGHNIHATDVEAVLYEHPAVQEAAVAAVPHDVLGEDVGAWIVLRPGATATADEITAFCRGRLADYKMPRRMTFVDALPRNATGKVLKRDLR
jgi:acyl-CoA synthetase (AMP-forming)/AMP-acid ligase II